MSVADSFGGLGGFFGWFGGGGSSSPPRPRTAEEWGALWVRGEQPPAATPPISAVGPIATDYVNPNAGIPRATPTPPGPVPSSPSARGPATPGTYPTVWRGPGGNAPIGGVPAALGALIGRLGLFGLLVPSDVADATVLPKGQTAAKKRRRGDRQPLPAYRIPAPVGWRPPISSDEPSMLDVMEEEEAHRARVFQEEMDRMGRPAPKRPAARSRPRLAEVRTTARRLPVQLDEVQITARRLPGEVPSRATPSTPRTPARTAPATGSRLRLPTGLTDLAPLLLGTVIGRGTRARPAPLSGPLGIGSPSIPPAPAPVPSTPTYTDPLTPVQPIGAAYPLAGSGWAPPNITGGSLVDQCRALNRRRKPKRRCVERDDCNKCTRYEGV